MLEKDEYIVMVSGTCGKFGKEFLIQTRSFTTNKGKEISAGQPNPDKENFAYKAEDGYAICALFGRAVSCGHTLVVYACPFSGTHFNFG